VAEGCACGDCSDFEGVGEAVTGGADCCGVDCVVCAKLSGRKKTKHARINLKERFLIVKINSGSVSMVTINRDAYLESKETFDTEERR